MTITGWNGSMTVSGIALPNWLVVVAAAAVAGLAWLRAGAVWTAPRPVPFVLAGYGLVHAAGSAFVRMASDRGAAGIGSLLSAATFVGMLVILARQSRAAA